MHQCDSEPPKLPWNCPEHIQVLYRQMLEERYKLTPYYYSYAVHASKTGEPILRPLVYSYQDDPEARVVDDQCMIGEYLMVAPVFTKGATERSVYFPEGDWFCWWSGKKYEGNQRVTIDAPLCEPRGLLMFVRAGAVIPMQELVQSLDDDIPEAITLKVYPGQQESTWTLEEESGRSTDFTVSPDGNVAISPDDAQGRFSVVRAV
jgi:alpha-glucosidase (family GH31 glycosyl hydrolase)